MFHKNQLPKSCFAVVAILLAIIHSPYQAHADIVIAGNLTDNWLLNGSNFGGNSNSLLARTGDIQNPLVGSNMVTASSRMQWERTGNVTTLDVFQDASIFKPSGVAAVGATFLSGFDVYAPAGTVVKLDYLGGHVSPVNTDINFHFGIGLNPWSFTRTITADPNFRITFEGRDYFWLLNGGFGLPSLNRVNVGNTAAWAGDATFGTYKGTFNWRVTNLSAVPEPTSLMLVGLVGLTALSARRRLGLLRPTTSDSCSTPIEQAAN